MKDFWLEKSDELKNNMKSVNLPKLRFDENKSYETVSFIRNDQIRIKNLQHIVYRFSWCIIIFCHDMFM